jgi:hypothetical protein
MRIFHKYLGNKPELITVDFGDDKMAVNTLTSQSDEEMNILAKQIKWIMLMSGLLTCTMLEAVFTPEAAVAKLFGESLQGPLVHMVIRSWGALITLIGLMLVYAAFNSQYRRFAAVVAACSKLMFVSLVLSVGNPYLGHAAWVIGFDAAVAIVLLVYVLTSAGNLEIRHDAASVS